MTQNGKSSPNSKINRDLSGVLDKFLTATQKRILLYLAEAKPHNIRELAIEMGGRQNFTRGTPNNYNTINRAMNDLKRKNLIEVVSSELYHGRVFDLFWLSETGVFLALYLGVDSSKLLRGVLMVYPQRSSLALNVEVFSILGTKGLDTLCMTFVIKGKIEEKDVKQFFANQIQEAPVDDAKERLAEVFRKYPDFRKRVDDEYMRRQKNYAEFKKSIDKSN